MGKKILLFIATLICAAGATIMFLGGIFLGGIIFTVLGIIALVLYTKECGGFFRKDSYIEMETKANRPQRTLVTSYRLDVLGSSYDCKFYPGNRQELLRKTRSRDKLSLRRYQWEGEDALAVMNDRFVGDIGVVGAMTGDLPKVLELFNNYPIHDGRIVEKKEHDGELSCVVDMNFYQ